MHRLSFFRIVLGASISFNFTKIGPVLFQDTCDIKVEYATIPAGQQNDGKIELSIMGGKAPYKVFWSGFNFSATGSKIKNLKPGYYSVIIIDANKCTKRLENIKVEGGKL